MNRLAVVAVVLYCGTTAGAQDPFPQFEKRVHKDGAKALPYRLLVPKAYAPGTALPLVVWLHGSGETGGDNVAPLRALDKTVLADAEKCPAFVMVPQCPPKSAWHAVGYNKVPEMTDPSRMTVAAVAGLRKEFGLDGRRIYVGGFSMGGCGTWELLTRYPDLFAAAFPIAGPPFAGAPGERPGLAAVVKRVPVWTFHGDKDAVAPVAGTRAIVAALRQEGADVTYTEYKGGGHECARTLRDPKLVEWLLTRKRATDPSFEQARVPEHAALIVKTLPDGERGTWTGMVERTGHGAARLPIDNVRYRLKPAANADAGVADLLARIGRGEATGEYAVTGTVELSDYAWLVVGRMAPTR
ncbi:dienelactone hydrolase family protein [bacterium]|nr:dienelactone hydrolase family protein [bacterium]